MGLTVQGDISLIYEELNRLKTQLSSTTEILSQKIEELNQAVFESGILLEPDSSWEVIRKKRNFLLKSTDWTLTPGSTVDQSAWATYRQILRDLPQTYASSGIEKVIWPKPPSTVGPNTEEE